MDDATIQQLKVFPSAKGGNLLENLIPLFEIKTSDTIRALKQAILSRELDTLKHKASTLKNGADYIGAKELSRLADQLEQNSDSQISHKKLSLQINAIEKAFHRAVQYFESLDAA